MDGNGGSVSRGRASQYEAYVRLVMTRLQLLDRQAAAIGPLTDAYRFGEMLAVGGMSLIASLQPVDPKGSSVVLKILKEDAPRSQRELLMRENHILRDCTSPHIVGWRGYAETPEGGPAVLMERVGQGKTLREHAVERSGDPLPIEGVCALFEQCLNALAVAHRSAIGHRDLKPANFLVTDGGRVKLADFMLAGYIGESGLKLRGTPEYHPPELARGIGVEKLLQIDLFALTLVFAEMLCGKFLGGDDLSRTRNTFASKIVLAREEKLKTLHMEAGRFGQGLAEFIRKGMSIDPENRFQSIAQMKGTFDFATINI